MFLDSQLVVDSIAFGNQIPIIRLKFDLGKS